MTDKKELNTSELENVAGGTPNLNEMTDEEIAKWREEYNKKNPQLPDRPIILGTPAPKFDQASRC